MIDYMYNSWHATQRGYTLAHNSEAMLRRMIDKRVRESREGVR